MTEHLTDTEIEELRNQFHFFDVNGSGHVEKDEMKNALAALGQPMGDDMIDQLYSLVDWNKDDKLNFEEFIGWNRQMFIEQMQEDFKAIDTDNSGYLDKLELKAMAQKANYEGITEEELDDLTYEMDENGNGRITIDEFIAGVVPRAKLGASYYVVNGEMYVAKLTADFQAIDADKSGFVDKSELQGMASSLHYALSEEELNGILKDMDTDNDGKISLEEFIAATVKIKVE